MKGLARQFLLRTCEKQGVFSSRDCAAHTTRPYARGYPEFKISLWMGMNTECTHFAEHQTACRRFGHDSWGQSLTQLQNWVAVAVCSRGWTDFACPYPLHIHVPHRSLGVGPGQSALQTLGWLCPNSQFPNIHACLEKFPSAMACHGIVYIVSGLWYQQLGVNLPTKEKQTANARTICQAYCKGISVSTVAK